MTGEEALAAELCVARLQPLTPMVAARVRPVLQAALEHTLRLPPLGFVADLVGLLERECRVLVGGEVPGLGLRRYDDRVVGPLVTAAHRDAVQDAYAALESRWRGVAAAVLAERLADVLEVDGPWWKPAAVRRLLDLHDEQVFEVGIAALHDDPEVHEAIGARITALAQRGPVLFTPGDVHLLRHLPALVTRGQRLAVRQVLEAAESFARELPNQVRSRPRPGPLATQLQDEDLYPTGGFSSLSRRGSFENLVPSELVYLEDGGGPDLFDVRYVENELLFYHRDESVHLRRRRRIHVVLDASLTDTRVKDPELPYQRGVLLWGMLTAVLTRVVSWLGDHELRIVLHPLGPLLDGERELVALVLGDLARAGVLELAAQSGPELVVESILTSAEVSDADVVWIQAGSDDAAIEHPDLPVEIHAVPIGPPNGPMAWSAWASVARELALFLG